MTDDMTRDELHEAGIEEAALVLMQLRGGPSEPYRDGARAAVEAYMRVAGTVPASERAEPDLSAVIDRLAAEVDLWRSIGGPERCATVRTALARTSPPAERTEP